MKKTAINLDKFFLRHIKRIRPNDSLGKQQAWARALTRNLDDRIFDDLGRHIPKNKEVFTNHQWEQQIGAFQKKKGPKKVNDRPVILRELRRMELEKDNLEMLVRPEDWERLNRSSTRAPNQMQNVWKYLGALLGAGALASTAIYKNKRKKAQDKVEQLFNKKV